MTASRVYLDDNATAPLRPCAREAMLAALETLGNPSSIHAEGRAARGVLEEARAVLALGVGAAARNLVFTSGATEAANLALTPHLQRGGETAPFDLLLVSGGEHPCVISGHRFPARAAELLPLNDDGALSLPALEAALSRNEGRRILLALQAANNETGVVQPVADAAALLHEAGGLLVCDATQAIGRLDAQFSTLDADVLLFSSHKLGGPPGAGALAFRRGDLHIGETLVRGGGQESGRRGGTENIAAIAGFAAAFRAATLSRATEAIRLAGLRDALEQVVLQLAPSARILGQNAPRLPNTSAFLLEGIEARTLAMALDLEGIAVSAGAACSSGKTGASHVLAAMGLKDLASLRVSLGWRSGPKDVDMFRSALARVLARINARRSSA